MSSVVRGRQGVFVERVVKDWSPDGLNGEYARARLSGSMEKALDCQPQRAVRHKPDHSLPLLGAAELPLA